MDLIFPCLTPMSQACLALSCKKFYDQFGFVLKTPPFRFPVSSGLDASLDLDLRYQFLLKLESKRWPWPYLRSRRWRYCAACLKLHPMKEFSLMHYQYDNPRKRQCRWPGITVLCPHLKLSPKKLMQIKYDLSSKACSYSIRTDIKKHIPQWHECSFTSPSGRISYTLTIALALSETDELVFESQYLIDFRRAKHYDDPEKIMLCPHVNTAERLGRHINLRGPGCGICRISPTVKRSDGNQKNMIFNSNGASAIIMTPVMISMIDFRIIIGLGMYFTASAGKKF